MPAPPFHAVEPAGAVTVCGESMDRLRFWDAPFRTTSPRLRCPACDLLLGAPRRR